MPTLSAFRLPLWFTSTPINSSYLFNEALPGIIPGQDRYYTLREDHGIGFTDAKK
jgi:hypothetical protein